MGVDRNTCTVFVGDLLPYLNPCNALSSRIEEVMESHILQVKESVSPDEDDKDFSHNIFEVFAAEKKKRKNKASKAPKLSALPPTTHAPATSSGNSRPSSQYRYYSNAEDQQLVSKLEDYLMKGKLALTTPAHIFAASPTIRKDIVERLKVQRVKTNKYKAVPTEVSPLPLMPPLAARRTTIHDKANDDFPHQPPTYDRPPAFCLPLQELNAIVNGSIKIPAILDTGSQIIVIWHDIVQSLGIHINHHQLIEMEGANSATNWTVGCTKNLSLQVGDITIKVHTHVVEHASFGLLLGQPFQ